MPRGTTLEVEIAALSGRGEGIAESPKGRLYVPGTVPGDRVEVRLGPKGREGEAAEMIALLASGPHRTEVSCAHFFVCGGCVLQGFARLAYEDWKRERVAAALARQGLGTVPIAPLLAIPPGDRRRADFVARRIGALVLIGFHRRKSHKIVDINECPVLDPVLVGLLPALREVLASILAPGVTVDCAVTKTATGIDAVIVGDLSLTLDQRERLADFATAADLARLAARNPRADFLDPIAVRRPPTIRIGDVTVDFPPAAFLQASPAAEAVLVGEVTTALRGARRIADLYAGLGTFALPLSKGAVVHAVEGDAAAGTALRLAAARAGRRVTVEARDLARRPLLAAELDGFDAIVFDPPRIGAKEQASEIARSNVPLVAAVSCAPSSFARDARVLIAGGYRLERVLPVDQFVWSSEVEIAAVFRRPD